MASPTIQFKRGAFVNLPGLQAGEPGFTTDKYDLFVGLTSETSTNKFFGSHRYWGRENGTSSLRLKLVDKDGNNSINLKSPDTLAGIVTYTLPETITNGYFLKTNSSGELSWAEVISNISIAADSGSVDTVSTGGTITFVGGTNINTAVTNDTITVNLDDNVNISGITTIGGLLYLNTGFYNVGGSSTLYNLSVLSELGVGGTCMIDGTLKADGNVIVAGITTFANDTQSTTYQSGAVLINGGLGVNKNVNVNGNLGVNGNVTIGGTTITLLSQDVYIQNKDIILGYTTSVTPNDDTANHAGVAIASTEGSPLVSFSASGINTLPDTYKQMMWFRSGTLGFATDAFGFNYGLAIGTTSMANGVRLAVGTGVTISDTSVSASTFYGSLVGNVAGNISSADQVKTVTAGNNNATYHITFVDANNGSATNESLYTDDGIYYNPGTNTFTTQHTSLTGNLSVTGVSTVGTLVLSGTSGIGITGISTSTTLAENSNSFLPTQAAVKSYVDAIDLTLGITADSGGPSTVATSQTLTISGTAGEVNTSVSGQTITVGLPDDVVVGTSLSSPTIKVATVQHSNGTQAATVDSSGNITASQNLTVSGNLYVNGSTTQVNTAALTVEDRTIDLGIVNGAAPSTNTTWDLGVLFNYYTGGAAKKSAVVWEHGDSRFKFASVLASDTDGSTVDTPQLTVTTFAPIEVSELWVNNTCTGGSSQVIACSGANLVLQNILIDGGTF